MSLVCGDLIIMFMAGEVSTKRTNRILLSSFVVLSSATLAACNNVKTVNIANVPTPEAASLHRVSLAETTNNSQEIALNSQSLAHLPAETSNKTKFSSQAFGVKSSPRVATTRGVRKGGGRYQIGKPYTIRGKRYYPKLDPNLRQKGLASWYGPNFHGRLTANGEVYDQYGLSAAHPTMPLPSYAKVTNLENGSSVTVRVNDRGPFSKNRVIDLSARAAQLLGYTKQGVAKVKVEYAGKAPLHGLDEQILVASYNPGRVNPDLIPPLPSSNKVLAQNATPQTKPAQNKINTVTNTQPVSASSNDTVPRPAGLVNSYISEEPVTNVFAFIDGSRKLNEPAVGMKNLVQLSFGPFGATSDFSKAEKLFEQFGILQNIRSVDNDKLLLVILAEEDTGKLIEAAKSAGIMRYTQQ